MVFRICDLQKGVTVHANYSLVPMPPLQIVGFNPIFTVTVMAFVFQSVTYQPFSNQTQIS